MNTNTSPHEPRFVLHALYRDGGGLNLWIEKTDGHTIARPDDVPVGTFPDAVTFLLASCRFDKTLSTKLVTPKGKAVTIRVTGACLAPDEASRVLGLLSFLGETDGAAERVVPAGVKAAQMATIGGDLFWFIRLHKGLASIVRSGRVGLSCMWRDGHWYPEWIVGTGTEEMEWLHAMDECAPGVIRANYTDTPATDCANELVGALCLKRIAEADGRRSDIPNRSGFAAALAHHTQIPVEQGLTVSGTLERWNDSFVDPDVNLTVVCGEPMFVTDMFARSTARGFGRKGFKIVNPDGTLSDGMVPLKAENLKKFIPAIDEVLTEREAWGDAFPGTLSDFVENFDEFADEDDWGPLTDEAGRPETNGEDFETPYNLFEHEPGTTAYMPLDDALVLWPVSIRMKRDGNEMAVIDTSVMNEAMKRYTDGKMRHLRALAPLCDLDNTLMGAVLDYFRIQPAPHSIDTFNLLLTNDEIVTLFTKYIPAVQKSGFNVIAPKQWQDIAAKVNVSASRANQVGGPSLLGLNDLLSVGINMEIDAEGQDADWLNMMLSSSGLIRNGDSWLHISQSNLADVRKKLRQLVGLFAGEEDEEGEDAAASLKKLKQALKNGVTMPINELRKLYMEQGIAVPTECLDDAADPLIEALLGKAPLPEPEKVDIPATIKATLRDYQKDGVAWLAAHSRHNIGCLLADDMGLGKTLQLLSLLAVEERDRTASDACENKPVVADPEVNSAQSAKQNDENPTVTDGLRRKPVTLVVCPKSVLNNWLEEALRFYPSAKVVLHYGPGRADAEHFHETMAAADIIVTTYATMARDIGFLQAVYFDHVVLDEAQMIKNRDTRGSRAARKLNARQRIALTGTPVENNLLDLHTLLDWCNKEMLGPMETFRTAFAQSIQNQDREAAVKAEMLKGLVAPFILRREKSNKDLLPQLPTKTEDVIYVEMSDEQKTLYREVALQLSKKIKEKSTTPMSRRANVLGLITRLKQICNHPAQFTKDEFGVCSRGKNRSGKLEKLEEIIEEAQENGDRMLIFTQYVAFGKLIQPWLEELLGSPVPFLTGSVSKSGRDAMISDFQRPDGPPVMMLSLKAGGTGLNLTAANVVVHLDRWWNPAVENQATDRAYRIGQNRNVRVYKMVSKDTLEERIQLILEGKTDIAEAIVGSGTVKFTEMTDDQIDWLINLHGMESDCGVKDPTTGKSVTKTVFLSDTKAGVNQILDEPVSGASVWEDAEFWEEEEPLNELEDGAWNDRMLPAPDDTARVPDGDTDVDEDSSSNNGKTR